MIHLRPIIGVMGSHENEWEEFSVPIGQMIAEHDYHLLTGAGGGVMMAVAKAFVEVEDRAGVSIGIAPTADYDGDPLPTEVYPNPYIEVPVVTPLDAKAQMDKMPYSKNYVNVMSSHAIIILPGSHGTRNEVSLAIKYKKPVVLFGPKTAFEKFPEHPTHVDTVDEVREFLEKATANFRT